MAGEFIFEPNITQGYIEQFASQEQLMHQYTNLVPKANKLYNSPFRDESRPSCSFFVGSKGDLLLKDFGTGTSLTWVGVVMQKYNCSYRKALRLVAEDLGLVTVKHANERKVVKLKEIPKIEKSACNIQVEIKEYSEEELQFWTQFGISKKILELYNVFSVKTLFLNSSIHSFASKTNFIFGYYLGNQDSLDLWKIYLPLSSNKGYRFLTNAKENIIQGWKQLPKSGDTVIITKSMKDVMLFRELGEFACAPNSETIFLSPSRYASLKSRFKNIVVFYDNDKAGLTAMIKIRKDFPDVKCVFLPKNTSKDISDYYKKYGLDDTLNIINTYKQWLKKK